MAFLDETGLARFLSNLKTWISTYGSASKLTTARKLKTSLASSADATFDGSANQENIPVTGVLPVANGGTGSSAKNFVDLSTNQSIAGEKTFSGTMSINKNSNQALKFKDANVDRLSPPSSTSFQGLTFLDKNNVSLADIYRRYSTTDNRLVFNVYKPEVSSGNNQLYFSVPSESEAETKIPYIYSAFNLCISRQEIYRYSKNTALYIRGGSASSNAITESDKDALLVLHGSNFSGTDAGGHFILSARNSINESALIGRPDGTLTWNGQAVQTSSDERIKTPLSAVPNDVLDAWGDVQWGQFRFLDAVERKGEKARLHLGMIAQRVKRAFEARGLDACAYGILCHEFREARDWDEELEDPPFIDENGTEHRQSHVEHFHEDAVDLWTVRYTEALAMEAAFQRRRADRLEARMAAVEERLNG